MRILVAGDFCPCSRVATAFANDDFAKVLNEIKTITSETDYSIINFECPVTKGIEKPIVKSGPSLKCSEKGIEALKWSGFDCITLANNHFLDYGEDGVKNTIETGLKYGLDVVGGGMNLEEASKILYKEVRGETLAIINCCEHEFSIATDTTAGSNPLNQIQLFYKILEARKNADYVLVIVHGGHEYYQLPSPRMQELYRWFVDVGADVVVNHHQHCFSGYEVYNDKFIFYGLGNFCFDGNRCGKDIWYEGFMVNLLLEKKELSFSMIPYIQCKEEPVIKILKTDEAAIFYEKINRINFKISNREVLFSEFVKWCEAKERSIKLLLTPYNNRIAKSLWVRGLLPSFFGKKRLTSLYDKLICESHNDILKYTLKKIIK